MGLRSPRPLTMVGLLALLVIGLALAFGLYLVFPQVMVVPIVLGVLVVVTTVSLAGFSAGRWWVGWLGLPAAALFALGTIMLSEDVAIAQVGEQIDAVVVDHTVDVRETSKGTRYTHEYSLERTDGQSLDAPLEYRGKDGYDDVEEGTEIEVLVDPAGDVPTELADDVDFGADVGVLVGGLVAVLGVFGAAAISVARNPVAQRSVRRRW